MNRPNLKLHRIFISAGHRFVGRHGLAPAEHPIREVEEVECVAYRGLRGDRYFDQPADGKGQVTLFAAEVFDRLRIELALPAADPAALRRNLFVSGAELNALIGVEFDLQGVVMAGVEECRPCYWMDSAIGPGAEAWLRGRGGLRCRILTSGWLHTRVEAPC
jgi:MOSC domain-containing protein YiiM